jgi:DNA-binding transcriptional MerR regulator
LNKAPDAFRTISEVADELDLPQHVLRFWESRFPHIKPLKRGGGRRYYRPDDIDLLRGIRRLLYADGYTIRGVQRILREQGVRTVQLVGQGQDVPSLATLTRDGDDDRRNANDGLAEVNFLTPPDQRAPDPPEDRGDGPHAQAPLRPQNGPIVDAKLATVSAVAVTPVARQEPAKQEPGKQEPVQIDQARPSAAPIAAPASVTVTPAVAVPASIAPRGAASAGVIPAGVKPASVTPAGIMPASVMPVAAAKPSPPQMAAQDLDRLKQALAELEACRRLLDKAREGGR